MLWLIYSYITFLIKSFGFEWQNCGFLILIICMSFVSFYMFEISFYFKGQETRIKRRVMCASLWFFSCFLFSISESQKCKHSLSGCLWCSVPHKASIKMTAKAVVSSEGSTEGGSACRLTSVTIDWVPCLVGPSLGQFTTWQLASLWAAMREQEREPKMETTVFL